MSMVIMCSRGCGHAIEVTDAIIAEAKAHGAPINVSHEVCPTDPKAPQRKFRIAVTVEEHIEEDGSDEVKVEPLAKMGETLEAGSFSLALPGLQSSLNEQWGRIVGMAETVDAPVADHTEESEGEATP